MILMSKTPAFQSFETSCGARVFAIPVEAFPSFFAYAYLVQAGDMLVLIDTGSGSERSHETLQAGLDQTGAVLGKSIGFSDLTHILVTHGHIDHFGGLVRIRDLTKAQIGIHELDFQTVAHHEERLAVMSRRLEMFLKLWGVGEEERDYLLQMYRFDKAFYKSVKPDFTFEDAHMTVVPFKMIHVPGHCPGHVAIRLDDIVFCGDLVVEGVTPHQSPEELTPFLGLNHYLVSLSRFERWAGDARLVLSGHDAPISNLMGRITEIRDTLSHRLHQTLEGFTEQNTVAHVCKLVYGEIEGYNSLLVQEKMGAYVEYLYQRGFLEISNLGELEGGNEFTVIRYRCSKSVPETELLPKERADVFI
jgi:glyoxylase-like metal-dependent hydrolase (beta-lactamase superfamily II)